jgi:glycosyltransferase involved in cell wall biosynthesis
MKSQIQKEPYIHVPETGHKDDVARITRFLQDNEIDLLHNVVIVAAIVAANKQKVPIVQMRHQVDYSMSIKGMESHVTICEAGNKESDQFDPFYVVYNGIDVVNFAPNPAGGEAVRKSLGIPLDAKVVMWAGRMHRDKGPAIMGSVVGALSEQGVYSIVIPLQIEWEYKGILESLRKDKHVRVLNEVYYKKLVNVYGASDFVLNTSATEGNGLTIMEGMSCGCVPVAFPVGGIPEIIYNNYNGMLRESIDEVVECIVGTDEVAMRSMSLAARRTVVRRFNLLDMVSRYEQIYRETIVRHVY